MSRTASATPRVRRLTAVLLSTGFLAGAAAPLVPAAHASAGKVKDMKYKGDGRKNR